jgi:hypothetical protein
MIAVRFAKGGRKPKGVCRCQLDIGSLARHMTPP